MRVSHFTPADNAALSRSTWITIARIIQTPACACPARKSAHCVSSNVRPPGCSPAPPRVRIPSNVAPPYITVGTAKRESPVINRAWRDRFIPHTFRCEHLAGARSSRSRTIHDRARDHRQPRFLERTGERPVPDGTGGDRLLVRTVDGVLHRHEQPGHGGEGIVDQGVDRKSVV